MLLLGHTGITLGAAVLLGGVLTNKHLSRNEGAEATNHDQDSSQMGTDSSRNPADKASWLTSVGRYVDLRLLLIGALLPDIIDKPTGLLFFRETLSNGRIFCHTLLFLILIILAGTYIYRRYQKTWLLVLAFGTFTHLIFDQMWRAPQTLFWPLFGFAFSSIDVSEWIPNMLHALMTNPSVYVPEAIGAASLVWFAQALVRRNKVFTFIKYGQVN